MNHKIKVDDRDCNISVVKCSCKHEKMFSCTDTSLAASMYAEKHARQYKHASISYFRNGVETPRSGSSVKPYRANGSRASSFSAD